jgi:uncharacterized 2Fe-2S/4Fe-4S cluster protein (DUF4445 family)
MAAETGAITRVHGLGGAFSCEVIGGGEPRGYCGSGLVDGVARLLEAGFLKPSGRFAAHLPQACVALSPDNGRTEICGRDVDALQRAKAASASCMEALLVAAGMDWSDLRRLCICGTFGRHLHVDSARAIGLLPPVDEAGLEWFGEAALTGCERLLLAPHPDLLLNELRCRIRARQLPLDDGYDALFVNHLPLRPIVATASTKEREYAWHHHQSLQRSSF